MSVSAGCARPSQPYSAAGTHKDKVLPAVGLDPDPAANRFTDERSGGRCRRVCIARALARDPSSSSATSPSRRLTSPFAQTISWLKGMKAAYGLTLLFIAHDFAVVKAVSDRGGQVPGKARARTEPSKSSAPTRQCIWRLSPTPTPTLRSPRPFPWENHPPDGAPERIASFAPAVRAPQPRCRTTRLARDRMPFAIARALARESSFLPGDPSRDAPTASQASLEDGRGGRVVGLIVAAALALNPSFGALEHLFSALAD
jgi:hypothetical protein